MGKQLRRMLKLMKFQSGKDGVKIAGGTRAKRERIGYARFHGLLNCASRRLRSENYRNKLNN